MEIKRIVRVFLSASLNELTEERDELGGFFTSLNNVFVERGLYFELLTGEDLVLATVQEDIIRNCEFFYVLFYRTAEKEVVEQFNTALARKTECGKPRIVTMFRELASDEKASDAVAAFMHRLDAELGHYYNYFSNIDSVKLSMLLEIARDETLGISLEFRDAKILVDGRKLAGEGSSPEIHLASVPFYAKNIALEKLNEERTELERRFFELKAAALEGDEEAYRESMEVGKALEDAKGRLHAFELELLRTASNIVGLSSSGEPLTERAKTAIRFFEKGEYEKGEGIARRRAERPRSPSGRRDGRCLPCCH